MPRFKLTQRISAYEVTWIEAESKEAALEKYNSGELNVHWDTDDWGDDGELIFIDEENGMQHELENGVFVGAWDDEP